MSGTRTPGYMAVQPGKQVNARLGMDGWLVGWMVGWLDGGLDVMGEK